MPGTYVISVDGRGYSWNWSKAAPPTPAEIAHATQTIRASSAHFHWLRDSPQARENAVNLARCLHEIGVTDYQVRISGMRVCPTAEPPRTSVFGVMTAGMLVAALGCMLYVKRASTRRRPRKAQGERSSIVPTATVRAVFAAVCLLCLIPCGHGACSLFTSHVLRSSFSDPRDTLLVTVELALLGTVKVAALFLANRPAAVRDVMRTRRE
jgi:hypothetical protein